MAPGVTGKAPPLLTTDKILTEPSVVFIHCSECGYTRQITPLVRAFCCGQAMIRIDPGPEQAPGSSSHKKEK